MSEQIELKVGGVIVYTSGVTTPPPTTPPPTTPPPTTPPPTTPPPVGTAGLERFDNVPGDSDYARWSFWQSSEFMPLMTRLMSTRGWDEQSTRNRINQQINAYGSGGINLPGSRVGNVYQFYALFDYRVLLDDINGAADAYIARWMPGRLPLGELK